MHDLEKLVRQFGEQTRQKTEEIAGKLGVTLDREFLDKRFAVQWALSTLIGAEAGEVVEMNEELARKAEASTPGELGVAFCLNTCRGGFVQIDAGDYAAALETFGLVRSMHGYLLKDDFHRMLTAHLTNASNKRHGRNNEIRERGIAMYRDGNFGSKNEAAKIIAKSIGRAEKVVRGWLQGI